MGILSKKLKWKRRRATREGWGAGEEVYSPWRKKKEGVDFWRGNSETNRTGVWRPVRRRHAAEKSGRATHPPLTENGQTTTTENFKRTLAHTHTHTYSFAGRHNAELNFLKIPQVSLSCLSTRHAMPIFRPSRHTAPFSYPSPQSPSCLPPPNPSSSIALPT